MSLRKTFKTDKTAEVDGVWLEVAVNDHNGRPVRVKLARMSNSNKRYTKALNAATKPHQSAIQNDALDQELAKSLLQDVFVDTVLLDWENLPKSDLTGDESDDDLLPFNKENALALFAEMPDLYDDWESRAQKAAAFRERERETAAGN
jgi:hypothetical protein